MRKVDVAVPPLTGSGTESPTFNMFNMWLHASGTFTSANVLEGRVAYGSGSASASGSVGPYFQMASFAQSGMYQVTGLADFVRCRQTSGSAGTMALTVIGQQEGR